MSALTDRAEKFEAKRERGRHRRRQSSATGRLRAIAGESFFRNSAFLIANLLLTAVCGFGAVSLLTRLYSAQAVGLSATALSASNLIAAITQFGVNYSLPRFLPTSRQRRELINTVLTVTMAASLVGSAFFLLLPVAGKLYALGGALFAILFAVSTSLDAGETHLEAILIADRAAHKITVANIVTNVAKVAAPVVFLFMGMSGAYASRIVVGSVAFVLLAIVLRRRGHRFRVTINVKATEDLRRFAAGAYIGGLFGSLPVMVLPVIILSRFGSSQSAYWYAAMAIGALLYQLPGVVGRALLAEVAQRTSDRRRLVYRAVKLMAAVMIPVFAVAYITAPMILGLFGRHYVSESLTPLRWLIIAGLISLMNYVSGTVLYLAKKTFIIAAINGMNAVIVLGLASTWAQGSSGVALAWFIGAIPNSALFTFFAVWSLHQVRYRWEDLGAQASPSVPGSTKTRATAESQLAGLDMLFRLATLQVTGPVYQTSPFSAERVPESVAGEAE